VEFETRAMLTNTEFSTLISNIRSQYVSGKANGRELEITAYIPETDSYVTQRGYMADFKPQMYLADNTHIEYDACRLSFIGGVAS
jgi:hypothetical protein